MLPHCKLFISRVYVIILDSPPDALPITMSSGKPERALRKISDLELMVSMHDRSGKIGKSRIIT